MPELPEVEVVRIGLETLLGAESTIQKFQFLRKDLRDPIPVEELKKLEGSRILAVRRRAKYLIFETDRGGFISHLGMSGYWRWEEDFGDGVIPLKLHDHIVLSIQNKKRKLNIIYNDPRRFGIFETVELESLQDSRRFKNLAPEPFSSHFKAETLYEALRGKQVAIKSAIMDQGLVVGVGNIYASEVLFELKIKPNRKARNVTLDECRKLVTQIQATLRSAIKKGGSTISNFFKTDGSSGSYQQNHKVYGREGEACPNECGSRIRSKVIGGRSSFFCPRCQR